MASEKDKVDIARDKRRQKKKKARIIKTVASWMAYAEILVGTVLMANIYKLDMIPMRYFLCGCLIILALGLISWIMARFKKTSIVSIVLAVVLIFAYGYGTYMVKHGENTLKRVTGAKGKEITVALYVLRDSGITSKDELKGSLVGYSDSFDETHVKKFISDFNKDSDFELSLKAYDTVTDEIDALLAKKVKAVIVNKSYFSVLSELSGYENVESSLYEVARYTYYEEIEQETDKANKSGVPAFINATGYSTSKTTMDTSSFDDAAFVVYLSGSDTREAVLEVSRSDVNILAFINPNKKKILLVNTPRDSYVNTSVAKNAKDKLTHVGNYGVDASMDTLGMLYGITPRYYLQVNFVGFEKVIDALGGITVNSAASFWAWTDPEVYIKEGANQVNGRQALAFVRERYAFPDSDNERGRNQMQVIKTVIGKVVSPAILGNYTEILNSMAGTFVTNMNSDFVSSLVKYQLDKNIEWEIETYAIKPHHYETSTECYAAPGLAASVTILDEDSIAEAIEKIKDIMSR